jgi:uncharacterized protein (DUF2141 family)
MRLSMFTGSLALLLASAGVHALEIDVQVRGVTDSKGEVGCALYRSQQGFPMDGSRAESQWLPANAAGVSCHFKDLAPGRYALAISHDLNGNRKIDTNFVGMPTEAWGVSNNVRPTLRAPRWDEAVFELKADTQLTVQVAR